MTNLADAREHAKLSAPPQKKQKILRQPLSLKLRMASIRRKANITVAEAAMNAGSRRQIRQLLVSPATRAREQKPVTFNNNARQAAGSCSPANSNLTWHGSAINRLTGLDFGSVADGSDGLDAKFPTQSLASEFVKAAAWPIAVVIIGPDSGR
jgi:hypothetical protein